MEGGDEGFNWREGGLEKARKGREYSLGMNDGFVDAEWTSERCRGDRGGCEFHAPGVEPAGARHTMDHGSGVAAGFSDAFKRSGLQRG